MYRAFIGLTVLVALTAPGAAQPVPASRTISVSGHAEVAAAPDRVMLSVAIETESNDAAAAVEENSRRSARVVDALKKLVGKDDQVTTSGYSVQPRYNVIKPGEAAEPKIVGYTAINTVAVESRQIDLAGKLIDAAIAAGANRISNLRFTLAERAPYLRTALEQAGKEARAQAESIATSLGVQLRGVLSASTNGAPVVQFREMDARMPMMAKSFAGAAPPIEAGDVTVSADVQVTYEIGDR